jgi:hypothetical protein
LIFKIKTFVKWQVKEGIPDFDLINAVKEIQYGLFEAELGGGLIKKRISRQGEGKSSGYRTIIATNNNNKWFFLFGFAKNEKDNITKQELQYLKAFGSKMLGFEENEIKLAIRERIIMEVDYE